MRSLEVAFWSLESLEEIQSSKQSHCHAINSSAYCVACLESCALGSLSDRSAQPRRLAVSRDRGRALEQCGAAPLAGREHARRKRNSVGLAWRGLLPRLGFGGGSRSRRRTAPRLRRPPVVDFGGGRSLRCWAAIHGASYMSNGRWLSQTSHGP